MSESNMKCYYCHECGKKSVSERNDPACDECGSEFVELIDAEDRAIGGGASSTRNPPFSITTTPIGRDAASSASATATTTGATATTTTTTTNGSRTPINITIGGSNPIFRRGGGHGLFNAFATGNVSLDGRESPMDTEEDPGDEVLSAAQLRRRTTSQVRGGARDPSIGMFPGGMFMVSQASRGGPSRQSLGQMIYQHIDNVLAQRDEEEQTDAGRQQGETQQQPQQPPQQQQQQPQQQPPQQQQPQQPQAGVPPSAAARGASGAGRGNIRVINFPSVQVMMSSRGHVGSQQQQQQTGASGVGQQQPGTSQAGSANPQLPQFGMPMFFGLGPQLGPMVGLHAPPSDYAWGPQGLENIISQMLANLEDDGPPPTKKEKLDSLPTVQATQEYLKECSLCSVCKDDFSAEESLLKLPCCHLYHKDCILPWLELHDTCPTCRFHVNTGKYDEDRTHT